MINQTTQATDFFKGRSYRCPTPEVFVFVSEAGGFGLELSFRRNRPRLGFHFDAKLQPGLHVLAVVVLALHVVAAVVSVVVIKIVVLAVHVVAAVIVSATDVVALSAVVFVAAIVVFNAVAAAHVIVVADVNTIFEILVAHLWLQKNV